MATLVNEKIGLFEEVARSKRNVLSVQVNPNFLAITNHLLLSVIVHNLLDNATKYCKNGIITIMTEVAGEALHMIIENTVAPKRQYFHEEPQDTHLEFSSEPAVFTSHGIGLMLVKDICGLLNLQFEIQSTSSVVTARVIFTDYVLEDLEISVQ